MAILGALILATAPLGANTTAAARMPHWSEEFRILDPKVWETQLYSFPANGCNMTASNVTVRGSVLRLQVERNTDASGPKGCNAGEIGSRKFFNYGLFVVRMKAPAVRGGVSAFFLMNQWQPADWEHKEIDIEFLGKSPGDAQFTTHDFQNGGRDWKSAATTVGLGLNYAADFHDYAVLWSAERVTWFVDGKRVHTETRYVPREPLQIRMNIYMGDPKEAGIKEWLGPRDDAALPAAAEIDWVHYYPLAALPDGYPHQ